MKKAIIQYRGISKAKPPVGQLIFVRGKDDTSELAIARLEESGDIVFLSSYGNIGKFAQMEWKKMVRKKKTPAETFLSAIESQSSGGRNGNLIRAILFRAYKDLMGNIKVHKDSAKRFMFDRLFETYCELIDLDPDYVRNLMQ